MKTSIYIPDNEWAGIKERIDALGVSLSTYLVMLHNDGLKSLAGEIADLINRNEINKVLFPKKPYPVEKEILSLVAPKPVEFDLSSPSLPKSQGWSIPFNPMSKERQSKGSNIKEKQIGN